MVGPNATAVLNSCVVGDRAAVEGKGAVVGDASAAIFIGGVANDGAVIDRYRSCAFVINASAVFRFVIRDDTAVDGERGSVVVVNAAALGAAMVVADGAAVDDDWAIVADASTYSRISSLDDAAVVAAGIVDGERAAVDDLQRMAVIGGAAQATVERVTVQVERDRTIVVDFNLRGDVDVGHHPDVGIVEHHRIPQLGFRINIYDIIRSDGDNVHIDVVATRTAVEVEATGCVAIGTQCTI